MHLRRSWTFVIATCLLLASGLRAQQQSGYFALSLGANTSSAGIAGNGILWGADAGTGFVCDGGVTTTVVNFVPAAANDSGEAAGTLVESIVGVVIHHAAEFSHGQLLDLGTLGGTASYATGINAAGAVVGYSYLADNETIHAFLCDNGVMTDIGVLPGMGSSQATGINSSGAVAGSSGSRAFLYANGTLTDLGTLGGSTAQAYAINDSGWVVGQSSTAGDLATHAFCWIGGAMTDLGSPLGGVSQAFSINNQGAIVGLSANASASVEQAVLWQDGTATPFGGSSIAAAESIDNAGQIVAIDYQLIPYLFTPTPSAPGQIVELEPIPSQDFGADIALNAAASSGLPVSYSVVSGPAAVQGNLLVPTGVGTVVIEADQAGNGAYNPAPPVRGSIVILKGNPVISWPQPAKMPGGTPLGAAQLDATANVPGIFTYSPPAGTVLPAGMPDLSVTFTPADSADYNSATDGVQIQVAQIVPDLTWATPAAIGENVAIGAAQLDATANVAGTFSYDPPAGTFLPAGLHTLTVRFLPADDNDYTQAEGQVVLTVLPTVPITWPQPSAVVYGMPLSVAQLDATATVPGTFAYSPGLGAVPDPGTQTLTVTFTPADLTRYAVTTSTVSLTVIPTTIAYVTTENQLEAVYDVNSAAATSMGIPHAGLVADNLAQPTGLAMDSAGNFYVAEGAGNSITEITAGGVQSTLTTHVEDPVGLALDSAGNLYSADYLGNAISEITPNGTLSIYSSAVVNPTGIAFDSQGNLYVAEADGTLDVISPAGRFSQVASGFGFPNGIAIDSQGQIYLSDSENGAIYKISPQGVVSTFTTAVDEPIGIAFDSLGNLWVADDYSGSVVVVAPDGSLTATYTYLGPPLYFLVLAPTPPPIFIDQPQSQLAAVSGLVTLVAGATGLPQYQWSRNGIPIPGATSSTLTLSDFQASDQGTYVVTATNAGGTAASEAATVTLGTAPTIGFQPVSVTIASGRTAAIAVGASGPGPLAYQWLYNGSVLANAQDPVLLLPNASVAQAGSYACLVSNTWGTVPTQPATLTVVSTANPGYLTNLSGRGAIGAGAANGLFPGFTIAGTGTKTLLLRAVGPRLSTAPFNLPDALPMPSFTLYDNTSTPIVTDAGWGNALQFGSSTDNVSPQAATASLMASLGAFSLTTGSPDCALQVSAGAGSYTAEESGLMGSTGIGLIEIYDADPSLPSARLDNISVRAPVGTGDAIIIAGFVIGGNTAETVLVRGVGPRLASPPFNLTGVLAEPVLSIFSGATVICSNSGWGDDPVLASAMSTVGAYGFSAGSGDAAILVSLPPGAYTAQVSGLNGTSGIASVEIYELP